MIRCTCGGRFETKETGVGVVLPGKYPSLYAADVLGCKLCEKRVIDMAGSPSAIGEEEVNAETKRLEANGYEVFHGRES